MGKLISLDAALTMFEANENLPTQSVRSLLRQIPAIDLAAVQPAQVRVKPLVWEHEARNGWKFGVAWATGYHIIIIRRDDGWHYVNGAGGVFPSIEAAKAEAQADYEARILAALEPQPDPRVVGYEQAYQYALTLADALMAKHYPDNKDWQPLGDLTGLLTQIDNMVAGKMPDPRDEVIARLVDALGECRQAITDYMNQYPHMAKGYLVDAEQHARAALAAAKAVQHD